MPEENAKSEQLLTDELLKIQSGLAGIADLYKSMDEAKRLVERATSDLKSRADDQWGITQKQLVSVNDALVAISHSAKSSESLASSLTDLAGQISAVDFPSRLASIESATSAQTQHISAISLACADLKEQAELVRADFIKLRDSTAGSVHDLAGKVDGSLSTLGALSALTRDLAVKVESTNTAISTLASSLSTLQSLLFRELESTRKAIEQSDSSTKVALGAITEELRRMKSRFSLFGVGVVLNTILMVAVLWKVLR